MSKKEKNEKNNLWFSLDMTKHYLTNLISECTFNTTTLQKEKIVAVRRIIIWKLNFSIVNIVEKLLLL